MQSADAPTLAVIVNNHEEWLASGGSEGAKAEIGMVIAQGADFSRRQLARAKFQESDLTGADFSHANLDSAEFLRCTLPNAKFTNTNLAGARFVECTGIMTSQFAGADLSGATLPESSREFPPLKRVPEIASRAQVLLATIVGSAVAVWCSLASISDMALLSNTGTLSLPGMDVSVPSATFVVVAPAVVLALWAFLVLTLQHLWEELAGLPKMFPDGEETHAKLDIWLFGAYASRHTGTRRRTDWARLFIFRTIVWCLVPFTTLLCWAFYIRRHESLGNQLLALLATAGVAIAGLSAARAHTTLRRRTRSHRLLIITVAVATVTAGLSLLLLSYAARRSSAEPHLDPFYVRGAMAILDSLRVRAALRVDDVALTVAQRSLRGVDVQRVSAARLRAPEIDLREAHANGADLSDADLTGARLESANLQFASLADAVLDRAKLQYTRLELAYLWSASFKNAEAWNARFVEASARGADFTGADLSSSDFRGADLQEAIFRGADLQFVNFYAADLRGADFTDAKNTDQIRCIRRANIASTVGLAIHSRVPGAGQTIVAVEEDDYRQKFAATGHDPWNTCGWDSTLGWDIAGPPAIRSYGVSPRSLRTDAFEMPEPLPRYIQRDVARLLDGLNSINTTNAKSAFQALREKLRYERNESSEGLISSRPGSPFEANMLHVWDTACDNGKTGLEVAFRPRGLVRRIDIDEFVGTHLDDRGVEYGTERRWKLKTGVLTSKDAELLFTTCASPSDRPS